MNSTHHLERKQKYLLLAKDEKPIRMEILAKQCEKATSVILLMPLEKQEDHEAGKLACVQQLWRQKDS